MRKVLVTLLVLSALFGLLVAQEKPEAAKKPEEKKTEEEVPEGTIAKVGNEFLKLDDFFTFILKSGWVSETLNAWVMYHIWLREAEKMGVEPKPEEVDKKTEEKFKSICASPIHKKRFEEYLEYTGVSLEQWMEMLRLQTRYELIMQETARKYRFTDEYMRKKFEEWYPKDKAVYWAQIISLKKSEKIDELSKEIKETEGKVKKAKSVAEKAELELKLSKLKHKKGLLEKTDEKVWVEDVVRRLRRGVPMEEIAKEEETGYGKTEFDRGYTTIEGFYKPLRKYVKKLSPGEVSDPIKDKKYECYFIIKLVDKKEPGELTLEDVKPFFKRYFEVASVGHMEIAELEEKFKEKYRVKLYVGRFIKSKK